MPLLAGNAAQKALRSAQFGWAPLRQDTNLWCWDQSMLLMSSVLLQLQLQLQVQVRVRVRVQVQVPVLHTHIGSLVQLLSAFCTCCRTKQTLFRAPVLSCKHLLYHTAAAP